MANPTVRRAMIVTALVGGAMMAAAAIAYACVPQEGGVQVENINAIDSDNQDTVTFTPGTSDGFIVGDGDSYPNPTRHHNSWCGDEGGHPTEAVYAEDGAMLEVTIREAKKDEVASGCPIQDNQLPEGDNNIFLENGDGAGDEDVYEWTDDTDGGTYPGGYWEFGAATAGVGCYHDDADPIDQMENVNVDGNGDGSETFYLTANTPNDWADPGGDARQSNQNPDPGDGASVLCVGDDLDAQEPVAIFAPVVVTSV